LILDTEINVSEVALRGYLALSKRFDQDQDNFQLLVGLLKSDKFYKKDMALEFLPGIAKNEAQKQQAEEILCKIVKDQDPLLSRSALGALSLMSDGKHSGSAMEEVLLAATKSQDPQTRMLAYSGLGKIMDKQAISALMDGIDSEDPQIQNTCFKTLMRSDDAEIKGSLFDRVASGTLSENLLQTIARDDPDFMTQAYNKAQASGNETAKKDIIDSLGGNPKASALLMDATKDRNPSIRGAALKNLGSTYNPDAVDTYVRSIKKDSDPNNRRISILNLRNYYDDPGVIRALEDASTNDRDERTRNLAKQVLDEVRPLLEEEKKHGGVKRKKSSSSPVSMEEQVMQDLKNELKIPGQ
jgi:HEAT repeat protein